MNGKELIYQVMQHKTTDKIPWVPFVGVHGGKVIGKDATEMLTSADNLAKGVIEAAKLYQADGIPVIFDLQIEAEVLGCELVWTKSGPPSVKTHPLEDIDEVPCKCKVPGKNDGRIPMVLETIVRVKKEIGDTTALYGLVCGPFTLASHLRGNNIFMDMFDDEEYVENLLSYCAEICKAMSMLYIDAGVDVVAVVDPLVSQISPNHFTQFMHVPFSEVFSAIRARHTFSSFFVCGNATRNIEVMCQTNPDSISVDENINMATAKEITNQYNIVIGGNIPLTTVMLHGNQQENMKYVVELIDSLSHKNLIISPGCDMPYDIPLENTIAAAQAVQDTESVRKMVENYEAPKDDIQIELPDYEHLMKPLIEVCTLDSDTCAACTYMMGSATEIKSHFGDAIDVVEYKYIYKEDIARFGKMGVKQLPSIYINGQLAYSSLIPSKADFINRIEQVM